MLYKRGVGHLIQNSFCVFDLRGPIQNLTFQHVGNLILVVVELEGSEETEGAQVEGHHGRHALLRGQHRLQYSVL